jgi:hypothetical protein
LFHLFLGLKEYQAVLHAVIGIADVVHAVWRLECEQASAATAASTWRAPSPVVLV